MKEVMVGEKYKHFKGNLYKVICIAKNTENNEDLVIYEHIETKQIWARPYEMFISKVDKIKYPDVLQEYRFEKIDE